MIQDNDQKNARRAMLWSRRGMLGIMILCVASLEGAYGCIGETGAEDFIEENIGEVQDAVIDAPAPSYFSCTLGVSPTTQDDCSGSGVVTPIAANSIQRRVEIDLDAQKSWKTFVLRTRVCDATGWTVNIGDSPTNNGYGGDGTSTSHDAEAQAVNGNLAVYRSDIGGPGDYLACSFAGPPSTAGCITQDWIVNNDSLKFDSNVSNTSNALNTCVSPTLFDFPGYDEADAEDSTGKYADKLYVGLNGVVNGNASRVGTGVQQACFFLSDSPAYDPAAVTARCGDMSAQLQAPENLTVTSGYSPVLNWADMSSGESGNRIERSHGSGSVSPWVGAYQVGFPGYEGDPETAEKLDASAQRLCEDAGYDGQDGYFVSPMWGGDFVFWDGVQWHVASIGGQDVSYLGVVYCVSGWTEIATTAANAVTYTDHLDAATHFPVNYRVRAYSGGWFSPYSNIAADNGVPVGGIP